VQRALHTSPDVISNITAEARSAGTVRKSFISFHRVRAAGIASFLVLSLHW